MRTLANWHAAVWAIPLSGCAALVLASLQSVGGTAAPPKAQRPPPAPSAAPYAADSLSRVVIGRDPFRTTRRPAPTAYNPVSTALAEIPASPKPALALTGIVWGVAPEAVLEGLPGIDAPRVVHQGDVFAGLKIRAIARNHVVITGLDTIWTLTVREPWK